MADMVQGALCRACSGGIEVFMRPLFPDAWFARLFDRLAARVPGVRPSALAACALAGLLAGAALVAFHCPAWGAPFLVVALGADGWGQAEGRRCGHVVRAASPLGLMLVPFGFALHDPAWALAAMFLVLALAVFTTQWTLAGGAGMAGLHGLAGGGLILACLLPNYFSVIAYLVGIASFIASGQQALAQE
jgi:hypothetical protein